MGKPEIEKSYPYKLAFYLMVLAIPVVLMTMIVIMAPNSALSPLSADPSKFLFFVIYFLPGLVMARVVTQNWRKTLGIGVAYILLSPAYYRYAIDYACQIAGTCSQV